MWYDEVKKAKKTGQDFEGRGAVLLVWRRQKNDVDKFSAFPESFLGEERDKQAVLAHATPAMAIMSGLLIELLKGKRNQIHHHEAPLTEYSVRHHDRDTRSRFHPGSHHSLRTLCSPERRSRQLLAGIPDISCNPQRRLAIRH